MFRDMEHRFESVIFLTKTNSQMDRTCKAAAPDGSEKTRSRSRIGRLVLTLTQTASVRDRAEGWVAVGQRTQTGRRGRSAPGMGRGSALPASPRRPERPPADL